MRCKKCGKEINELEIYCEDCKELLKKEKELNELIDENKKLNELENTKELINLDKLVEENLEQNTKLESIEDIVNIDDDFNFDKKNRKATIFIVITIIFIIVFALVVFLVNLLNKEETKEEQPKELVIDYQKVINEYGDSASNALVEYLKENEEIPSWSIISDLIQYNEYEVICDIHNMYNDGSLYLNECRVDDKEVKYSYGVIQQEEKEGKKIEIYEMDHDNGYKTYFDYKYNGVTLAGTITCKTEICEYINAYDKYALVKENNEYYIYNYENNTIEFGPFTITNENYSNNILSYENKLYGVLYETNGEQNIYNVNTSKTLKNIKGDLLQAQLFSDPGIMYKYGYAVLQKGDINGFVNLKTGNVSYTIDGTINNFIEDTNKKLVYITTYNSKNSKITIYNSNGKKLFKGKEYDSIIVSDGNLLLTDKNKFYIYDSNLKLKLTSKEYDSILGSYNDFVVVVDNEYLEIIDLNDEILATFDLKWDSGKYTFHSLLSGWYTDNGKNGIYLVVENNELSYGTIGSGLEYYYIPDTGEIGVIETEGVGGYAKPVLYLYPEEKTDVTITFSDTTLLTTTYPKFKDKWQVTAYPNGDLYDKNNKYYYGLYWEEDLNHFVNFSEGFYVEKDDAIEFLEEKLEVIGLNDKERNEFIMYWLPILEQNKKSLVYFELTYERDSYNKLIINPKPDSMLRIAIHVKKVNKKTSIKEQKLKEFDRYGFSAIEWGGVVYK